MFRRLSAALLALLGAVLLLSACTSGGHTAPPTDTDQTSSAPTTEQAVPEEHRATAEAFAKLRAIDSCALHDIEAAKQVTGDQGDEILPADDGLNLCVLRLHKSEFESTWSLHLEVGARFDSLSRSDSAQENLGGLEVYTREDERGCTLDKPLEGDFAIELRASTYSGATKAPCDVLREYATKLAPLWTDPPRRGGGATSPELSLAKVDPCTAASALLDGAGAGAALEPEEVFGCTVTPARDAKAAPSKTRTDVEVSLILDEDPAALVKPDKQTAREITVGKHRAVLYQGGTGCTAYIVWEPDTTVVVDQQSEDALPALQQIRVDTGDCDAAQAAAEKIVAKVGTR